MTATNLRKQVQALRSTLRRLDRQLRGLVPALAKATVGGIAPKSGDKRKLKLSPARRRALKLQGSYLGYMRQLKPAQKARVKAVKANGGMRPAIAMARRMAGRRR